MSHQLINRSPDLKRLRDEGYEIEIWNAYLIVHSIPYVNSQREIKLGKLIAQLTMNNNISTRPNTHVIHFMGEAPCNKDGSVITSIEHAKPNRILRPDVIMNYSFSNKPKNGYADNYQKVTRYIEIITAPARSIDPSKTAKSFKVIDTEDDSVFNYYDTNTSRANIGHLLPMFSDQKVAIIGLGGTGSYVLDFVSKTPVQEILLFDDDSYEQHSAFRSPGASSKVDFSQKKVEYYSRVYSRMHRKVISYIDKVTEENIDLLNKVSFVFICIDDNLYRKLIIDYLSDHGIPFIDTGIGLNLVDGKLIGTIRITTGTKEKKDHFERRVPFGENDSNDYSNNIQTAELNALAAVLSVIKWKKILGFYQDLEEEHHSTYDLNVSQLCNDETKA